tara:strand:- start:194 stop:730 length:537 start_codon:yes stop_codon:yes gene_type:complete
MMGSQLEEELQDMFDGSVQWQITDFDHNNKMMSAKGTFSLVAPITIEKSVLELIESGDVPYPYYDILYEDEITMIHFEVKNKTYRWTTAFFLQLMEDQDQTVLVMSLQTDSLNPWYEEVSEKLLDRFGNWKSKSRKDTSLILETRFNNIGDNVKVAKKVVDLTNEVREFIKAKIYRNV